MLIGKPKLILHIGTPKTGTTSLQNVLFNNRDLLLENDIFYNPNAYSDEFLIPFLFDERYSEKYNKLSIGWITFDDIHEIEMLDERCIRLRNDFESSGCNKLIISAESLFYRWNNVLELIKEIFFNYKINVVCYVRRQDLFLESHFDQNLKNRAFLFNTVYKFPDTLKDNFFKCNMTGMLPEFIDHIYEMLHLLDYYKMAKHLENIFGEENLLIRIYEKNNLNTVDDFFYNVLNITPPCEPNSNYSNELRLGKYLSELKLQRNIFNTEFYKKISIGLGNKYKNINYFTDSARAAFLAYFSKSNEMLAREYLKRGDGVLFYAPIELYDELDITLNSFNKEVIDLITEGTDYDHTFVDIRPIIWFILKKAALSGKSVLLYGIKSRTARPVLNLLPAFADKTRIFVADKSIKTNKVIIEGEVFSVCKLENIANVNPGFIIILIRKQDDGNEVYKELISSELDDVKIFPCHDFSNKVWKSL